MPFANHTPYDHFPRRLHPREIGNPYLAIHQFFDWENFPEWRNHLDRWLQAALKSGFQLNRIELVELFVRYEFIELLVEALSLVQRLMDSFHMPDQRLYRQMANDSDKLLPDQINTAHGYFNNGHNPKTFEREEYYPFHLEAGEKKNPHGVIYDFFKYHDLPQYRDALYWWYIVAIDYTCADDSRGSDYIYKLHSKLQKVIEAAHLIHIRTKGDTAIDGFGT
ncbi:hypothetical protein ACFQRK_10510 [Parapedobacter sp. GCM10030251]|jgi:hypothetical protein|uniref:hypothetical protein n=1 Tax=Parapedobacter sp. GCM10030251 TaxID=3273419 RepID=UPI0036210CE6